MSLYKQLWIAVAALMLTVFSITFVINGVASSRYLEQQLTLKNTDDATALALSLSQQELDTVAVEIQLAAKVDQGSYEFAELRDPAGALLYSATNPVDTGSAPGWLKRVFPIDAEVGRAAVTNGWNQIGTVYLKSHDGFAYDELWASGKRTLIALVIAVVVAGAAGTLVLRMILRPLGQVVEQAEAIGERRFMTLPEPFTTEFAVVTRSMNELARRVKEMLSRESQRLERQREAAEIDRLTGLMLREPFMRRLRARLESEGSDAVGSVAILRINQLAQLNQLYGRNTLDTVLKEVGGDLKRLTLGESDWAVGRLNGSDFCMLAPGEMSPRQLGESMQRAVMDVLRRHSLERKTSLPTACVEYAAGDTVAQVMTSLDGGLLSADHQEGSPVTLASRGSTAVVPVREQAEFWRRELSKALTENRLLLEAYPVYDGQRQLIHNEAMLRVRVQSEIRSAGEFMPWVHRLDMSGEVDRAVVRLALEMARKSGEPVHANLSSVALTDQSFAIWVEELLVKNSQVAPLIGMEVNETAAYSHPTGFHRLSQRVHEADAKLGVEHMGYRISDIGLLGELGVDYMKIDSLFIRDIDTNEGNRALVLTYARIAQSLGVPCIAEGVRTPAERKAAFDCGATGVTGPGIKPVV